jgi:hypothetical protein
MTEYMFDSGNIHADCSLLYNYLDYELGGSKSGTARRQMFENGHNKKENSDGYSVTIGHTFRKYISPTKNREPSKIYKGMFETVLLTNKPNIMEVITEFGLTHFPNFDWTEIQVNYNWASPPHFDKANGGDSLIFAMGDYTGGELNIDKGGDLGVVSVDIHDKPFIFDGHKYRHWTNDYLNNRMSVVFYSLNKKRLSLDD